MKRTTLTCLALFVATLSCMAGGQKLIAIVDSHIAVWPIFLIVLIGVVIGLWFLIRFLASQNGAQGVGVFTMIVGAIGVIVPLFVFMGNSSRDIQLAVLISGAIIFGCGSIATAIGKRKE